MYRNYSITIRIFLCGAALFLLLTALFINTSAQGYQSTERISEKNVLSGRVLAYVDSIVAGAGLGPRYETFIFGVKSKNDHGEPIIVPVEVVYAYFKSSGPLPQSFFDYSKHYKLKVMRDTRCDERLSVLSYEQNEDETGKPLPPTRILHILDGVDKDILKTDLTLPCYMLRHGNYQIIK